MSVTDKKAFKNKICDIIDGRTEDITAIGDAIRKNPELGYKEFRTADLSARIMKSAGLTVESGLAVTGVKGRLVGKHHGPTIALIGEMDALPAPDHPWADPETGVSHNCGHDAQIAGLLGAVFGLTAAGIAPNISGTIIFLCVPAEEYVYMDFREGLVKEGMIAYLGGKQELIRLGQFDDVDLSLMIHVHSSADYPTVAVAESSNGFVVKKARFLGKSAHAGVAPHQGINALNAAHLAIAAIHAQRETFRDEDAVRVHPIITRGGDSVNAVPSEVWLETFVRARTAEAMQNASDKVDRSIRAGAMAIGAGVEIKTMPGYLPMGNNPELGDILGENSRALFGKNAFGRVPHRSGSTDMGDLSQIMPALHPYLAGATGSPHGDNWQLVDRSRVYIRIAKLMAMTAVDLLWGKAEAARSILKHHQPTFTREQYTAILNSWSKIDTYDKPE